MYTLLQYRLEIDYFSFHWEGGAAGNFRVSPLVKKQQNKKKYHSKDSNWPSVGEYLQNGYLLRICTIGDYQY